MSSSSQASASSSQFELIINAALSEFKKKTGKDLLNGFLANKLNTCDSVEAVMIIIEGQAEAFDKFKNGGSKLMKWVRSSVHVLYTISTALGDGVGVAIPSAKAVFTGIGVLLAAAKDVWASHDVLVDLFERIQFFLKRLGVHTRISPTKDMVDILVKIMAEVIGILSIATKEMQRSKTKMYLRKLLGSTDIEDALKKLDSLTQEEVRMAIAQVLQGINELKDDARKVDEALREMKWNQIEQDVRRWLSSPDPSVNYNIARRIYQEGTAVWFLESRLFKEWDLIGSLLWIHGKPGSGKSILCASIIKHVISLRDAGSAALAYYYFDFRDEEKRNLRNFVTSLLIQLSDSVHCRNIILRLYSTHDKGARQPDIDVLIDCLKEMLKVIAPQPVYVIVDALDECPGMSGMPTPRETVLGLVEDLAHLQLPFLHLCITSRPEADIKEVLEPLAHCVSLHDENGQQKDILDYVKAVVSSDRKMRKWRDEEKKLVVEELSNKVDGMFRWAFCQLEVLRHCLPASIRSTLDQLPDTLDETYARVLSQISQANQAHAHRLLQCLMVAVRPLRVEELAEVLAFEFDTVEGAIPRYRTDWQLNDQEQAVLSTCSSLVAIVDDKGSQVVQFSHFSVKEFLMSDRLTSSLGDFSQYHIHPGPAHTILAQACLGILLHDPVDKECVKGLPLAAYAAKHWVTHAQFEDVASRVKNAMESLFDYDKPHFAAWVRKYDIDIDRTDRVSTPLYYSSLFGFSDLVEYLAIKHPHHVNIGGRYEFPLLAALVKKHVGVAEILLKHGADVDIGMRERRPLGDAITDVNVVQFLLKHGADVNCQLDSYGTPLHLASCHDDLEVVRMLLEHKANVDSLDEFGDTPMHKLIKVRNDSILNRVQLLLEHGADINRRGDYSRTPLHLAIRWRKYEYAVLLLRLGADAHAEDDDGNTPLYELFEAWNNVVHKYEDEHECKIFDIVRLSVEHGADINIRTPNGWTLLHVSACSSWPNIAKVLLDHGANANARTESGTTPLHAVADGWRGGPEVDVAQLLLARGADVNFPDKSQNTPLHEAALKGELEIAKVLLDHGANTDAQNNQGETPLHLVLRPEYYDSRYEGGDFVRLLLRRGADLHAKDKDRNTVLHSAASQGMLDIVQVLLEYGAKADTKNDQGETPLHRVSRRMYGSEDVRIAQLLLERGVDVNGQMRNKWTPLHLAAFERRLEIAKTLLDHGANPNAEDEQGGINVARLLLERGADVNAPDKDQYTPFDSASYSGRFDIARLFVEHGATSAKSASRGTKRKADDVGLGSRPERKPKHHGEMHLAPWRHAHFTDIHARRETIPE